MQGSERFREWDAKQNTVFLGALSPHELKAKIN